MICEECLRPKATDALWAHPDGCECAECVAHCWGPGTNCETIASELRSAHGNSLRALRAEYDNAQTKIDALTRDLETERLHRASVTDQRDALLAQNAELRLAIAMSRAPGRSQP